MTATAFDLFYPYDAGAGSAALEAAWTDMFRCLPGSGVIAGYDLELAPAGDSTGQHIKVQPGRGWFAGQFGKVTTQKTLAVAGNGSGQPRVDLAVVRNNFSGNQIELDILTGTPGSSPVAPTPTSNSSIQEFPLATIGPLASGFPTIDSTDVHDVRCILTPYGLPSFEDDSMVWWPYWLNTPLVGFMVQRRDQPGIVWYWSGSTWLPAPLPVQCGSGSHPAAPFAGMHIFEYDTGKELTYQGPTDGFTPPWNLPWGQVNTVYSATDQSVTTEVDVTKQGGGAASITFTALANRLYRYTVTALVSNFNNDGDCVIRITDASNAEITHGVVRPGTGGDLETLEFSYVEAPGAGSITRKLRATSAAALMTMHNSVAQLRFLVEDIGSTGASS